MPGEQQAQQTTFDQLTNSQDENIKRTAQEIAEITGTDSEKQKVQLEGILTTEFANTLKSNPNIAKALYNEIPKQEDGEDGAITQLRNFLEPIANPHQVNGTLDITESENQTSVINKFSDYFGENGSLKGISLLPQESQNAIENIKKILNNPTKENIQELQDFLYNNLPEQEKDKFKNSNRKSNNRDGSFGDSTENALNFFLKKTADYVNKYNEHIKIAEEGDHHQQQEIQEATDAVNGLTNPTQESYDAAKAKYDEAKAKYGDNFDSNGALETKLNEIEGKLKINETREKASKATISFDTLSQKLQTLNNSEIDGILTQQIAPLNEQLKQGPSINELNAKRSELEGKIKSYDRDSDLKIDKHEKQGNRKTINDLQNELKQVEKELNNKTNIKNDLSTQLSRIKDIIKKIISSPDNTENEIILKNIKDFYGLQNDENTSIIKKENEQGQEQDRTPFSQYERSLDDIGNGKEPSETSQGENTPEQTNQTQTPEQAQKAVNKPRTVNTGLSALFDKVGFKGRDETIGFWKNIGNALGAVFGYYFGFSMKGKESGTKTPEQTNDELKIKLDGYNDNDNDIKKALEEINNIQGAFNGRQEIVTAINETDNNKKEQQIKNLQRKLRTFPTGQGDKEGKSPINITGTIDKPTAEALRAYAQKAQNNTNQKNDNAMPYALCEGYTPIDISKYNTQQDKQYEAYTTNDKKDTILITKDSSGNIESIKKGRIYTTNNNSDWDFPKMMGFKYSLNNNTEIIQTGFNDGQNQQTT